MLNKLYRCVSIVLALSTVFNAGCTESWRNPYPPSTPQAVTVGAVGGAALGVGVASLVATDGARNGAMLAGGIVGLVAGSLIGYTIAQHLSLVKRLQRNGVQVIQVGDELTLILPSDRFFTKNTPLLNSNYYSVLDEIAALLTSFEKYTVEVDGYTDNTGSPERNLALSRQQALNIADYLWKRGIDTRLLSSNGYGDQMPIARNSSIQGHAMNRRVEIKLRLITDDYAFY